MKRKILITGSAGSGKSTLSKEFTNAGFESYDLEDVDSMFAMYHKNKDKIFEEYDNANPEHIKNAEWICNIKRLKELQNSQKSETAFYFGIASNMDDIIPLFNRIIVLDITKEQLNERLKNREGTDDIGNTQRGRDVVLGWKDWWDNEMRKKGAIFVNAMGNSEEVFSNVLSTLHIKAS